MTDPRRAEAVCLARHALTDARLRGILEIRTAIQQFLCRELEAAGYVHPPIYMLAGCTDPLNHLTYPARLDYYGEEISLTQSLIFQKILMVMLSPMDKVFWASPNIRMETGTGGRGYKYTTEFMQVDFEKRHAAYAEMLGFVSGLVRGLFSHLNEGHADTLRRLRGAPLPELKSDLEIFDAQEIRRRRRLPDDDAVERWAAARTGGRPFFLVNLRREAYDCFDETGGRFLNYDVVLPPFGHNPHPVECLSGAERTRSLADLRRRMAELRYPEEYFQPFFEIFTALDTGHGIIACAGGGFGVERLTFAILGLEDIHAVYPIPRPAERRIAL
jgi:aspartyl/asparaginyl-tRNA synthetase